MEIGGFLRVVECRAMKEQVCFLCEKTFILTPDKPGLINMCATCHEESRFPRGTEAEFLAAWRKREQDFLDSGSEPPMTLQRPIDNSSRKTLERPLRFKKATSRNNHTSSIRIQDRTNRPVE